MSALRVGLIGCGRIAQSVHLKILTRLPDVELVALAEPDAHLREQARRRAPSAAAFSDYSELLERSEAEAVIICLPNALHAEAAVAALQQGKHVYLEKPLAISLDEGRRVLEAWQRAGVVGMMGFNYRFNPLYHKVKQHVQSGRLGELVSVRSVFSTAAKTLPAWKQTRQSGGGVLLDLASHHVDLVRFFFGQEVSEVFASLRSQCSEGDSATLQLRLADGLLVQSFFSLSAVEEDRFEIYGQAGKLAVDRYSSLDVEVTAPTQSSARLRRLQQGLRSLRCVPYLLTKLRAPNREPSYQAALTHFVDAVRTHHPASPDFTDGYRSLSIVAAAEQSARTGRVTVCSQPRSGSGVAF
jgi:predicted dehydrogenase